MEGYVYKNPKTGQVSKVIPVGQEFRCEILAKAGWEQVSGPKLQLEMDLPEDDGTPKAAKEQPSAENADNPEGNEDAPEVDQSGDEETPAPEGEENAPEEKAGEESPQAPLDKGGKKK